MHFRSEETDKAFHNLLAFFPVGVATFREKTEYQREGNPFIGDAQHENVDIELSETSSLVRSMLSTYTGLDGSSEKIIRAYDVKVKKLLGKESLERLRLESLSTVVASHQPVVKADSLPHRVP